MFNQLHSWYYYISIIVQTWKQLTCPSIGELVRKLWYSDTMDYDVAMKRNKLRVHTTAWIDLRGVVLWEKSQPFKITYCMILFT